MGLKVDLISLPRLGGLRCKPIGVVFFDYGVRGARLVSVSALGAALKVGIVTFAGLGRLRGGPVGVIRFDFSQGGACTVGVTAVRMAF